MFILCFYYIFHFLIDHIKLLIPEAGTACQPSSLPPPYRNLVGDDKYCFHFWRCWLDYPNIIMPLNLRILLSYRNRSSLDEIQVGKQQDSNQLFIVRPCHLLLVTSPKGRPSLTWSIQQKKKKKVSALCTPNGG